MKKYKNSILIVLWLLTIYATTFSYNPHPPRLVVNLVVDQLSYEYINQLYPYLKHGLKYLLEHSTVYTNAFMPHGQPGTATGHAGLNTGTYAQDHGFIGNTWYENGIKVACDDDSDENTYVFSSHGNLYNCGKSSHRLMVDGLSDQCILQSKPNSTFSAYSISLKSRAAIATAGKLGKALWIDSATGQFTSSKAYFNELPLWLKDFNLHNKINRLGYLKWKPMYPQSPYAYQFFDLDNYAVTRASETLLNTNLPVPDLTDTNNPYQWFEKTPYANQYILDCALSCIQNHVSKKHRDRLLLWVCLGPLDKIGHRYGPQSMEAIDMIYHLDRQLKQFIRKTMRIIGKHELIFTLTADHGIMPIPELLQEKGLTQAQRIDRMAFVKGINTFIKEKYTIDSIVKSYKGQEIVFDSSIFDFLDAAKQQLITDDVKQYILKQPGIKNVWLFDELIALPTQPGTLQDNIKKQLFKGRSGSLVIQPYPYTVITHWKQGAAHKTPYNYDTHVPLLIFYPGKFGRRFVRQRVTPLQLANTLAEVLNIPKPSASTCEILPELFDPEYK